jgi:hypothetical protein
LLPTLSRLSVSHVPASCLRHWCSSRYLRISPLHREFHSPLPDSSPTVSARLPGLSPGLSERTYRAAYTRFTPNNSGQRLPPTYYRGCWHVVSRGFFWRYRHRNRLFTGTASSLLKGVYNPKAVFPHAALLRHAFAHCARFPTAASRRSLGRVSVPVWLIVLSDQLPIAALVGHYPTNKLMGRGPISMRKPKLPLLTRPCGRWAHQVLARVSPGCPCHRGTLPTCYSPVRGSAPGRSPVRRSTCMC